MAFENHLNEVLNALSEARQEALNNIGTFVTAEAQLRAPVKTGNMRRSTTFDIVSDNEVDVGVTPDAPYSIFIEKGCSRFAAKPFLQPAITDNIDKIQEIAGQSISLHMGGD